MNDSHHLDILLQQPMLKSARKGEVGFLKRVKLLLEQRGWTVEYCLTSKETKAKVAEADTYALFYEEKPTHGKALTCRVAYHFPFWHLDQRAERWRIPIARAVYNSDLVHPADGLIFAERLRSHVLPGPGPRQGDYILIPLQDSLRICRSFQTMSPIDMVETVARTGRPVIMTLHPRGNYDREDMAALDELMGIYPNLSIEKDAIGLLRDCLFVATQNSRVAFDGFFFDKPVVLFAQTDFHHIALNVSELGAEEALQEAPYHRNDFASYLYWFLRMNSLQMSEPDADDQVLRALKRCGWPVTAN